MPGFLILHHEKEGTSHVWWLLHRMPGISMVHQADARSDEPFDRHQVGSMPTRELLRCLEFIFSGTHDQEKLNEIYTRYVDHELGPFDAGAIRGLKMRYHPPDKRDRGRFLRIVDSLPVIGRDLARKLHFDRRRYREGFASLLLRNECVVFYAVRQDIFRWALSLYHGDGTGKDGHLQFDLAVGKIRKSEIPAIRVDPSELARIVRECRKNIRDKMQVLQAMSSTGIRVAPLFYERLCDDPQGYLGFLLNQLDHAVCEEDIAAVVANGSMYEKVHSTDISSFVINHEEISESFGDCFIDFDREYREQYGNLPWQPAG
jgi:hypothetical protein